MCDVREHSALCTKLRGSKKSGMVSVGVEARLEQKPFHADYGFRLRVRISFGRLWPGGLRYVQSESLKAPPRVRARFYLPAAGPVPGHGCRKPNLKAFLMTDICAAGTAGNEKLLMLAGNYATVSANFEKRRATEEWTDEQADDALLEMFTPLEDAAISARATSIAGLVAKARMIHSIYLGVLIDIPEGDTADEQLAWSIVRDILAIDDARARQPELSAP